VAFWDRDTALSNSVDYRLVHNSFVTMFWQTSVLQKTVAWLTDHHYDVVALDASDWGSADDMLRDVAAALSFPDYFGQNFDALNDCMLDVAYSDYGWRTDATGLVLVFTNFERFAAADRQAAQTLLDILAERARLAALIGTRLICLVQSNDPRLSFDPVGATPVMWNDAEWLYRKRGL
jgi:RNAse (barnase) inhibitor barstar